MTNINLIKQSISVFEESLAEYQQMKTDAMVLGSLSELSAINNAIVCTETALETLQSELDRQENKALTIEELILLLDENERYPIWYQYANYEPNPEIMTAITTNRHTGEHKIYFIDENFAVVSEHTKFYKYKPKGDE